VIAGSRGSGKLWRRSKALDVSGLQVLEAVAEVRR
jgi:hypothetical protein